MAVNLRVPATLGASIVRDRAGAGLLRIKNLQFGAVVRATPLSMLGHVVNVTIAFLAFQGSVSTGPLTIWAVGSYSVAAYLFYRWITRSGRRPTPKLSQRGLRKAIVYGAALAAPWGVLGFWLLGNLPPQQELILIALCVGMSASGSVLLSGIYPAAIAYMACILVPVAIRCFGLIQEREYLLLGALTLSFMAFLLNCINSCARLFAEKSRAVDDLQKSLEKTEIAKLELEHAALHDALTGLPNRRAFLNHLTLAAASDVSRPALFYIDLDRFKPVNDSFGHVVGDKLLEAVALRLRTCLQPGNFIARLGGDEFTFIASVADEDVAERRATSILDAICQPYCIEGHEITLGAGIGIAVGTEETNDTAALLKMADLALHESKQRGGNRYCCYQPSMLAKVNARRDNEKALVLALVEDQFELHYQPIFDLSSLNVVAAEALIRWRRPRRGLVFPEEFLPLAEEMQLIQSIGAWVLDRACSDAVQWPDGLRVAVNLSAKQVAHLEIASTISTTLAVTNLAPNRLELEITESAVLGDDDLTKRRLLDLKSLGITLAVDDFGTGYSSLAYLSRFPFDRIKIDRAFVGGLVEDRGSESIVRATVDMAKGFGMQTTAEGVETRQQFFTLRKLGIDLGQGYLFSRPLPAKDFAKFLSYKTNLKPSNLIEQNDFLLRSA